MSARAVGRPLALTAFAALLVGTVVQASADAFAAGNPDELPHADVTMTELEPESFARQASELPSGLVEAVERDLDLSAERYLARAAAAKVAGDVVASLGDIVTAAWLDGQTLHIAVKDRSDEAAAAATGATVHVGDALTDAVQAARSQGRVAYPDREEGRAVPVESEIVGESARSSRLIADNQEPAGGELSGGFGYWTQDTLFAYECTAGFTGVTDDGDPVALTAGHCSQGESGGLLDGPINLLGLPLLGGDDEEAEEDEGAEEHEETEEDSADPEDSDEFGTFLEGASHFGGGHDAAILSITGGAWSPRPSVTAPEGDGEQSGGLAVYDSIAAIEGAPACKSGVISGWTCSMILDAESTVPVSGKDVAGFMLDACTLPGDGGGPVVIGNYALGVSSGTTWEETDCSTTTPDGSPHVAVGYALSGGTNNADMLYGNGWGLSIHVGEPQVEAPVAGDVTGEQPTVKGTIDAAAGATVVVTVEGAQPVEATVQPDGTWRAPISDPLEPGQHSYRVTASHKALNAGERTDSGTVTGTFRVAEVATLAVAAPTDGETTRSPRPTFTGTGNQGAQVTLEFDNETTSTVVDDDGTWSITPREAMRAGRYDAVVTQNVGGTVDDVSVKGIGIVPGAPLVADITDDVASGHEVAGTAIPGSTVAVRVQPTHNDGSTGEYIAQTGDEGAWEVELPGLEAGTYSVTAVQAVDDLTSERSASMPLDVSSLNTRGVREVDEDDLAETGRAPLALILASAALLALGGLGIVVRRRIRTSA